jgi:hypothetical protein
MRQATLSALCALLRGRWANSGISTIAKYEAGFGNRYVLGALTAEEDNLVAAWETARRHGWLDIVIRQMQGLGALYGATGRRATWRRLIEAVVPDFVDPANDGPLPGRDAEWSVVTGYRVRLAEQDRRWLDAERLDRICVDWSRQRAGRALAAAPGERDSVQRNAIRSLASDLHELGEIRREQGDGACAGAYREAMELAQSIGDRAGEMKCAFALGVAYTVISALYDYEEAESWFRRSLDMVDPDDRGCPISCVSSSRDALYVVGGSRTWHERSGTR